MIDYGIFTNEEEIPGEGIVLKRARAKVQSPGGVLSNTVKPEGGSMLPNASEAYRTQAKDLSDRAMKLMEAPVDYSAMQQMARDRGAQGDMATLNALAAQFAGENFAPLQEQMLKKAAAAREPIKMGGGLITSDGAFIKDPEAGRDKEINMLLQRSAELAKIAETADTARERIAAQRAQNELQNQLRLMGLQLQQQGLQLRADTAAATRGLAQQNADERRDRKVSEDAQKLSKQSEDLTNLVAGTRRLNDQLGLYAQKDAKGIPGVGYGTDINIMGFDVSGPLIGEEGKANRSMVKNVANELLRLASGQAVTLNEAQRQQLANMASGSYSERDFLNAWENVILPKVNEAVANVGGGYSQQVKDRYGSQGGRIDFNKPFEPPARNKPQAGPASRLSAQEQAELEALRQRFGGR